MDFREPLEARALLLAGLRSFFAEKKCIEVYLPVLLPNHSPELHTNFIETTLGQETYYLQSSFEIPAKNIYAQHQRSFYSIGSVYRAGETSRLHRQEFQMCEWYQHQASFRDAIVWLQDMLRYVEDFCGLVPFTHELLSFSELSKKTLGVDCSELGEQQLRDLCESETSIKASSQAEALDALYSHCLQPSLQERKWYVVQHFPKSLPALAKLSYASPAKALRFELVFAGIEVAHGFAELQSLAEMRQRCEQLMADKEKGALIANGYIQNEKLKLPPHTGVSLGIERLMLCLFGYDSIEQVC